MQTADALVRAFRSQALLITTLLILTARFQTDPSKEDFYNIQMNGRNFLVSVREVLSLEKNSNLAFIIKRRHNLLEQEPNHAVLTDETYENLKKKLPSISTEILKLSLCKNSEKVAVHIGDYACKQLNSKIKYENCMIMRSSSGIPRIFKKRGAYNPNEICLREKNFKS